MDSQTCIDVKNQVDDICELCRLTPEDREDISQGIMAKLLNVNMENVQSKEDFIFIVSRNHITDFIRKSVQDEKLIERLKEREILRSQINNNDDHIEDLRIAFEEELENLPPQQKKIMEMVYDGISRKQIAEELDLSDGQVRVQLHIARKKIQNKIDVG